MLVNSSYSLRRSNRHKEDKKCPPSSPPKNAEERNAKPALVCQNQNVPCISSPKKHLEYSPVKRLNSPRKFKLDQENSPLRQSPRKVPPLMSYRDIALPMSSPLGSPISSRRMSYPWASPVISPAQSPSVSPTKTPTKNPYVALNFSSPTSLLSRFQLSSPATSPKKCSPYRALCHSLSMGTSTRMVCREKQMNCMESFLEKHLCEKKPGSMYISGAPGTGKTATLAAVIQKMQIAGITKVEINCMTLRLSGSIYQKIAVDLGLKNCSSEKKCIKMIEKTITTCHSPVFLVLDEIDQLDSKNQEILYTIFEWPSLHGSKLVLLGIANALDLTDRILPRLQASAIFQPQLLHFPPYSKSEIVHIIEERIRQCDIDSTLIRPQAIQFLAGKVSAVAGDVRKALDVCRRAVEVCEIQQRNGGALNDGTPRMVEIPHIMRLLNEVYGSRVMTVITESSQSLSLQQKMCICTLLLMIRHSKFKCITLGKFHEVYGRVCKRRNLPILEDQGEFHSVCSLLESRGIVLLKANKEVRKITVTLRLNYEEAEQALGDKALLASVMDDKECLGNVAKHI